MVLQSIKSVFTLMTLIGVGYFFYGKKWFGKTGMDFLSKFTVQVSVPCYMFVNMYYDVGSRGALLDLALKLPITVVMILLCLFVTYLVSRLIGISEGRRFTFVAASGFSNVVFIGFPVIQSLWGEGITTIGTIYYLSSTVLFWTVGIWLLKKDSKMPQKKGDPYESLKKLMSPPIIGMLLAVAVILLGIPVPEFLLSPLSMIKGITSPLAMVFIGSVIRSMDRSELRMGKDLYAAIGMRFVFLPLVNVLFLNLMPISTEMRQVFFMLSAMPSMTQMGMMAREYDSDYEFACTVITATTLISMLSIPVYMFLMQTFQFF